MAKFITKNRQQTEKLGEKFALGLKGGDVLLLYGNLGAGKTTFTKGLAKGLKISERIISPTFVLHRIHPVKLGKIKKLNHIDLYRLEKADLSELGLSEVFNEGDSVTIIEWADRLDQRLDTAYSLKFENLGENNREIVIEPYGEDK